MRKRFSFGKENLGGEIIPAQFDEKNMTTDFLTDFLFEGNAVVSSKYSEDIVGFISLNNDEPYPCHLVCSCASNYVRYNFIGVNYLEQKDIDNLILMIEEYFKDDDNLEVELVATTIESRLYPLYSTDPCLFFYRRG